jgi:hypothetical protein
MSRMTHVAAPRSQQGALDERSSETPVIGQRAGGLSPGRIDGAVSMAPQGNILKDGRCRMEWVLLVSLQWVVAGSPTPPTTSQIQSFASEELCNMAADKVRNELNTPIGANLRAQTLGRVVCLKVK